MTCIIVIAHDMNACYFLTSKDDFGGYRGILNSAFVWLGGNYCGT